MIESLSGLISDLQKSVDITRFLIPLAIILGGLIVGWLVEKLAIRALRRAAAKTVWPGDDIIVESLRGVVTALFLVGGMYVAVSTGSLSQNLSGIVGKALLVVVILVATLALARVAAGFVGMYTSRIEGMSSASLLINVMSIVIFVAGCLVALESIGVSVVPFLAAFGVVGLAVGLALQETLQNLFAGLFIVIARQFKPGDYVKLDSGYEGYIHDITWRNTTIRTLFNNEIIVPNSKLSYSVVTNYHTPAQELSILVPARVGYGSDLRRVEEITVGIAKETVEEITGGISEYEPLIRYNNFGESGIEFSVILWTRQFEDQFLITHELIMKLHERYEQEGIDIPFPIRTVRMEDKDPDEPDETA